MISKIFLFGILLFQFDFLIYGQLMRWYYTGQHLNEVLSLSDVFKGQHSPFITFEEYGDQTSNESLNLFNGGNLVRFKSLNTTVEENLLSLIKHGILGSSISSTSNSHSVKIESAYFFTMLTSINYAADDRNNTIVSSEIGLFDHSKRIFTKRLWRDVSGGELIIVRVSENRESFISHHNMLYSMDLHGRHTLVSHTWNSQNRSPIVASVSNLPTLKILTYNLWHNNPPSWVYQENEERWQRYEMRLRHFADVIVKEDPDVITLQEVRLDTTFTSPTKNIPHGSDGVEKVDGGSQVEHVLNHLAAAWTRLNGIPGGALNMIDMNRPGQHVEDGVMVLSKLPILHSDVLLLPRELRDPSDDHQRTVLRVQLDGSSLVGSPNALPIDVLTTHLSLSERARDLSVREISRISSCRSTYNNNEKKENRSYQPSNVQLLTGDFNAEPNEAALQYLMQASSFNGAQLNCDGLTDKDNLSPFVDTWMHARMNALRAQHPHTSHEDLQAEAERDGFTFPACSPVKRIDFILARNHSSSRALHEELSVSVLTSRIVGSKPTADTEYLVGSREGLGMLDSDSPIWASDHFGLLSELRLHYKP
mmetsp:Transcript_24930/g.34203  ORF Transcript_24930/g.34203 Transcript_24930/m.34203 type:complete len:592 (+) Transcript_24930:37-1812(+)